MSKIISGFNYANRVLALQVANLDETIKALTPHFVYCGKPIEGKNVQHKLEVALGYETKTQKLPEVRRMKIVLEQLAEGAEPTNKVKTTKETFASTEAILTLLAGTITGILDAEAKTKADADAAAKAKRDEAKAQRDLAKAQAAETRAKNAKTEPTAPAATAENKVEPEAKAAATVETTMAKPQLRDAKGRFLPRQ